MRSQSTQSPKRELVVDLFAGPGGWDEAARQLGLRPVGVEHEAAACATRAAAGHLTIRADVSQVPTAPWRGKLHGLIGSPPCPTFSSAGNRAGIAELRYIIEHVHACVTGWREYVPPVSLGRLDDCEWCKGVGMTNELHYAPGYGASGHTIRECPDCAIKPDPRSALVLEPLRFALNLCPDWIALEQVPDVLPVWEAYRYVLQAHGYSVWCGILNSADYGVPQTRRRAILMAHRREDVSPPVPTHCEGGASTLLGELAPWISMAEALGWGFDDECAPCVSAGGTRTGGAEPFANAGTRARLREMAVDQRTNSRGPGGTQVDTVLVPCTQPAPTVTALAGGQWIIRGNNTVAGGPLAERDLTEPAMTVGTRADLWAFDRPATTVQGDPRVAPPGHRDREGGEPQFGADALKLSVSDALKLQSFDADYPVQGNKGQRFTQVGNAIPPKLALAILSALASPPEYDQEPQ